MAPTYLRTQNMLIASEMTPAYRVFIAKASYPALSNIQTAAYRLQRTGGMLPPKGMLAAILLMKSTNLAHRPSAAEPFR